MEIISSELNYSRAYYNKYIYISVSITMKSLFWNIFFSSRNKYNQLGEHDGVVYVGGGRIID